MLLKKGILYFVFLTALMIQTNLYAAATISITSGPTVIIPGITTATVIQLSGYAVGNPVRWLKAGGVIGGGPSLSVTSSGSYFAQVNMSTNPSAPFWVGMGSITIPDVQHSIQVNGPNPLDPNSTTQLCLTSTGSAYITAKKWFKNIVEEPSQANQTCRSVLSRPGSYSVAVTYHYGSQNVVINIPAVTIFKSTQAPVVSVSKTTYDPVSTPPVLSVTNMSSFSQIRVFLNNNQVAVQNTASYTVTTPGRYMIAGFFSNGTSTFTNEIIITKGSVPTPSISSGEGYELTYTNSVIRLYASTNYNAGYSWYVNNQLIPGTTSSWIDVSSPGSYKVTACAVHPDGQTECKTSAVTIITGEMLFVNSIRVKTALISGILNSNDLNTLPKDQANIVTTYSDGFARPIQQVQKTQSPIGNDLVSFVSYDGLGRETKKYLPFVRPTQHGQYSYLATDALAPLNNFYQADNDNLANTTFPFAQQFFESSPLNRPLEVGSPGEVWQPGTTHTVRYSYTSNSSSDNIFIWKVNGQNLVAPTNYAAGMLNIKQVLDEQGNKQRIYTDKQDRQVVAEVEVENGELQRTYFVYNDLGKLKYVIPSKTIKELNTTGTPTISETKLSSECFRYTYDVRGRMIVKQLPGAAPVYMVYDPWDRVVLSQDGNQRQRNVWSFTKYDVLERPLMTGEINNTLTHENLIQAVATFYADVASNPSLRYEESSTLIHGYTNRSYPVLANAYQVYNVFYHDNYSFLSQWQSSSNYQFVPEASLGLTAYFARLQGMLTGAKSLILGTHDYLNMVNYYDDKYRLIQLISDNPLGGQDRASSQYDFTGKVLKEIEIHQGINQITTLMEYTYDHIGRPLKTFHQINNNPQILLSKNHYNEIGELVEKNLHSEDNGISFLQSLDYAYNIRGWLTTMNAPQTETNTLVDDMYAFELKYNESITDVGVDYTPAYNGNISAFTEIRPFSAEASGVPFKSRYAYKYDKKNQLKQAKYYQLSDRTKDGTYDVTGINYDPNGNILQLKRKGILQGVPGIIDDLQYTYSGNQLLKVDDTGSATKGFIDK